MAKSKVEYWLTSDGLTLLSGWARDGLTDEQIANNMSIAVSTFYEWKKRYPEISEPLKKNKEIVDVEVENALLKNALGYEYFEEVVATKKEVIYNDGKRVKEMSEPVILEITKYKHPETTAQIYWLNNRRSKQWRNKHDKDNSDAFEKLDKLLEEQKNA